MNPRERVLCAARLQEPDRVPFHLGLTPPMYERFVEKTGAVNPADHWGFDVRGVGFRPPPEPADYLGYFPEGLPEGTIITEWGVAEAPADFHHFTGMIHPLRHAQTVEEIVDYPLPDFKQPACWEHLQETVSAFQARDLAVAAGLEMTIFEVGWYIRGMEELFNDMMMQPELAEAFYERLTDLRVFQTETVAHAGVDILALGDDVSTQRGMLMSPRMWRKWLKPRLARVIAAAKEIKPDILVQYHTDGDCRAIIPELIEVGVDILNPVQPECMDPAEIKNLYGNRLSFSGTIGTQTTMPFGTTEEVRQVVRERVETVGRGGGLLLAPSHVLEPDVPWENVEAFVAAVKEYER